MINYVSKYRMQKWIYMKFVTKARTAMGGYLHAPAALPPGMTRYPLYKRLGGPQAWSGRVQKISPYQDSLPGPSIP